MPFPFETLLAAQRTATAGPKHLFSQGVAIQRAFSGATLRALEGQVAVQRLGLEAVRATTRATRQAVGDPTGTEMEMEMETGRTPERARSESIESTISDLYAAHSKLLDAFERELEDGIDAVDECTDAQVDTLAAGTALLLAVDRRLGDEAASDVDFRALEQYLDRTRSVDERLDERFELRRHEPTAVLSAQLEQLE
ncbi:hypothetical protein [Halosolutus halophilus]|uniref:hypothetical protein n=1 Tax=Halosolutus halophilus TaxID=1552990 RepID=UPI0022351A5C|nr:hypothetical protein [Halosolutus halophilus]